MRPRASPVPKEMGRWGGHHPLGPAGSRGCQQHFLPRWEKGLPAADPEEGGISSPKPGRTPPL